MLRANCGPFLRRGHVSRGDSLLVGKTGGVAVRATRTNGYCDRRVERMGTVGQLWIVNRAPVAACSMAYVTRRRPQLHRRRALPFRSVPVLPRQLAGSILMTNLIPTSCSENTSLVVPTRLVAPGDLRTDQRKTPEIWCH